jgi:outer membrane protein assembly factor BamE (lipoprotein component of BamABCDE complex)
MMRGRKLLVLPLAGALAVATMGADSCSDTGSKQATDNWNKVHVGMSKAEVRAQLGKPTDKQSFETGSGTSGCLYYGLSHQVCYDESGTVESKNSY